MNLFMMFSAHAHPPLIFIQRRIPPRRHKFPGCHGLGRFDSTRSARSSMAVFAAIGRPGRFPGFWPGSRPVPGLLPRSSRRSGRRPGVRSHPKPACSRRSRRDDPATMASVGAGGPGASLPACQLWGKGWPFTWTLSLPKGRCGRLRGTGRGGSLATK